METQHLIREILRLKAKIRELESQEASEKPEYFIASGKRQKFAGLNTIVNFEPP